MELWQADSEVKGTNASAREPQDTENSCPSYRSVANPLNHFADGSRKLCSVTHHSLEYVYQTHTVNKYSNGIDAYILILLDERIAGLGGELRNDGYTGVANLHMIFHRRTGCLGTEKQCKRFRS
jgi:hypothetical protein